MDSQFREIVVTHPRGPLKPLKRFGSVTPLSVDRCAKEWCYVTSLLCIEPGPEILRVWASTPKKPQVLELLGKSQALLGCDRPELIADHAKSLDGPIAVETSEKTPRAICQL